MTNLRFKNFFTGKTAIFTLLTAVSLLIWIGCAQDPQSPNQELPAPEQEQSGMVLSMDNPLVMSTVKLQNEHTESLMANDGVVGTATSMTADGQPAIKVYVESLRRLDKRAVPKSIEGTPVIVEEVGKIVALKGKPGGGGGVDPTARFDRPVPLGISTGHPDITAGTIGCRVTDGNNVYILSNNHVYANENAASINDDLIQPGTFDGGSLNSNPSDYIGQLHDFEPIVFSTNANNVIDAAIASTTTADMGNSTPSDGYGTPKTSTVTATPGLRVRKYGRTTGQTNGRVDAVNATVNVGYDNGVARFVGQIIIKPGSFGAGGDSGSLVVVQKGGNANSPVGLYFAGSSAIGIANPIDDVLSAFNVTVDGN